MPSLNGRFKAFRQSDPETPEAAQSPLGGRFRQFMQQAQRVDPQEFQRSEDARAKRLVDAVHGRQRGQRSFLGDLGGILTDPEALDVGVRSALPLNPVVMGRGIGERVFGSNEDARAAASAELPPDAALFDVRDNPIGSAAVDVAETLLGPQQIGQTALDETGSLGKPLGNAAIALTSAFRIAPRLAAALGPAGKRIAKATGERITAQGATGGLTAAPLGAAMEMRAQGLEEPVDIATSAAAGLGAGVMPINTLNAVVASMGYDLLTGAAEAIRRDPASAQIVNKMLDGQEVSAKERQHLVTQGVMYGVPAVAGNIAAGAAARVGESRGRQMSLDAARAAVRRASPRVQQNVEDFRTFVAREEMPSVGDQRPAGYDTALDPPPRAETVYPEGVSRETIAAELAETPTPKEVRDAQEVRSDPGQPEVAGQVRQEGEASGGGDVQQGAQARPAAGDAGAQQAREVAPPVEVPKAVIDSKPKYGTRKPEFESPIDKAAYVVRNRTKLSKSDSVQMEYAKAALGTDEAGVRAHGQEVHSQVKRLAKGSKQDVFTVPKTGAAEGRMPTELLQTVPDDPIVKTAIGNEVAGRGTATPETMRAALNDLNAPKPKLGDGPPEGVPARLKPAPIKGAPIRPARDVIRDLEDAFGTKILQGENLAPGVAGKYRPPDAGTSTREFNDMDTISHEISHRLDDETNLGNYRKDPSVSEAEAKIYDKELMPQFSAHGSPSRDPNIVRMEGVAEYLRAWMLNPRMAEKMAPQFTKRFLAKATPKQRKALREYGDGVRAHYGARAIDQIGQSIEVIAPDPTPAQKQSLLQDPYGALKQFLRDIDDNLYTGSGRAMRQFEDMLKPFGLRPSDLPPSENVISIAVLRRGIPHMADQVLAAGMPTKDYNGTRTPGGLPWVFEPIIQRGSMSGTIANLQEGLSYAVASTVAQRITKLRLATEKRIENILESVEPMRAREAALTASLREVKDPATRQGIKNEIASIQARARAKIETAKGVKIRTEAAINKWLGSGAGMKGTDQLVREALDDIEASPDRGVRAKEFARRYKAYADSIVDYLADTGWISAKKAAETKSSTNTYAAMNRLGKTLGSNILAPFKGSTRDIRSPVINLMNNAIVALRLGTQNEAYAKYTAILNRTREMYGPDFQDTTKFGRRMSDGTDAPDGFRKVLVYRNGEKETWAIPSEIADLVSPPKTQTWGGDDATWIGRTMQFATDASYYLTQLIKRSNVTSPQFQQRVLFREPVWGYVQTGASVPDFFRYLVAPESNPEIQKFIRAGGSQAAYGLRGEAGGHIDAYYGTQRAMLEALVQDKSTKNIFASPGASVKKAFNYWERHMVQRQETATRMAEWKRAYNEAKKMGYDERDANMHAALAARQLIDYAEMGLSIRWLNRRIPFLNAALQGQRNTVRRIAKDPQGWLKRNALAIMIPSAIVYASNWMQGPEVMEEYYALPDWRRDFFYNLRIAPNTWIVIPKPFEAGLISSAVERAFSSATTGTNQMAGLEKSVLRSTVAIDPGAFAAGGLIPFVEAATNYSFFFDRSIVPPMEEGKEVVFRRTEGASNMAQFMADAFGGFSNEGPPVDPRKIDHLIQSYFGGWGSMARGLSDAPREDKIKTSSDWLNTFSGLVKPSSGPSSKPVQDAMRMAARMGQLSNPSVRELSDLRSEYFNEAATNEERERVAREMIQVANELLIELGEVRPDLVEDAKDDTADRREERTENARRVRERSSAP